MAPKRDTKFIKALNHHFPCSGVFPSPHYKVHKIISTHHIKYALSSNSSKQTVHQG